MKNITLRALVIALYMVLSSSSWAQNSPSHTLLKALERKMQEIGSYEVSFSVVVGGEIYTKGNYIVEGDKFCITMGELELFSDGKTLHTVNTRLKEVAIDALQQNGTDIISNPTKAFSFVSSEYDSEIIGQSGALTTIRLTSKANDEFIVITIDTTTSLPKSISYGSAGEIILVEIEKIGAVSSQFRHFDKRLYADYEIIDFR